MNEKSKRLMENQQQAIYDNLKNTFNLPVFEDELGEDELPEAFNYFYIIYGDFRKTDAVKRLIQEIYIVYVTEKNPDVETTTLDIITTISKVSAVEFNRTVKERYQKKDSDEYVDQVTIVFTRKIAYE
jgi:hypothetical protein